MKLYTRLFLIMIISCFLMIDEVNALSYSSICSNVEVLNVIRIFGVIIKIIKIVIPLLIIVFGMIDFSKSVVSSDDKAINKSSMKLVKRIIAGILIYFLPTLVLTLFDYLELSDIHTNENFYKCTTCLLDINSCK